ncbi:hypothetical protein MPLB_1200029 [Mesorhizobium sp. ORS 3324]|nr:hypothetical protein MPLB_1200029 [Mesorhizobium sp. ORS 3324]
MLEHDLFGRLRAASGCDALARAKRLEKQRIRPGAQLHWQLYRLYSAQIFAGPPRRYFTTQEFLDVRHTGIRPRRRHLARYVHQHFAVCPHFRDHVFSDHPAAARAAEEASGNAGCGAPWRHGGDRRRLRRQGDQGDRRQ